MKLLLKLDYLIQRRIGAQVREFLFVTLARIVPRCRHRLDRRSRTLQTRICRRQFSNLRLRLRQLGDLNSNARSNLLRRRCNDRRSDLRRALGIGTYAVYAEALL